MNFRDNLKNYNYYQKIYLLFFIVLPFVFTTEIIDPIVIPRQFILTIFLSVIWIHLLFNKSIKNVTVSFSKLSFLLLFLYFLLILVCVASIFYSKTISESIYVTSKYGIIFLYFITTYFLLRLELIKIKDLSNGVILFSIISCLYGIYDISLLIIDDINVLSNSMSINSTFANKNLFASALILCLWAILYKLSHKKKLLVLYATLTLVIILLWLLQSKIAIASVGLIFIGLTIRNMKIDFKKFKKVFYTGALIAVVIFTITSLNFSKFENLSSLHTLGTRYALWINSIKMFIEYPFGVGAGNWQIYFPKYGLSHFDIIEVQNGLTTYQRPHNDFIWILCELGIQGLLLYLSFFTIIIIMLIRCLNKSNTHLTFLLLLTIISYCLIAFFDFPLERIEHQILLSSIVVIIMNNYDTISLKVKPYSFLKHLPIFFSFILFSFIVSYYRFKGEYYTRQFISLHRVKFANEVITNCEKAKSFFYTITPISVPIDWYAAISLYSQGKVEESRLRLLNANKYSPYSVNILTHLGNVYEKKGLLIEANYFYNKALKISPNATISKLK